MTRGPQSPRTIKRVSAKEARRFDEANVARLGLISIQERIPNDFLTWIVEFDFDGRKARLRCDALPQYGGVPHGLDGDIATAIIGLFVEADAPADGVVNTTAYRVLQRAGLPDGGRYYQAMRASPFRLRNALYTASDSWFDVKRKWVTVTFNYLEELAFTAESEQDEEGNGPNLARGSVLRVRLAKPIVRSIRAKYV